MDMHAILSVLIQLVGIVALGVGGALIAVGLLLVVHAFFYHG